MTATCKPFTISCGSILANGLIELDESENGPTSRDELEQQLAKMLTDKSIGKILTEVKLVIAVCIDGTVNN